jgi:hypothetical protein
MIKIFSGLVNEYLLQYIMFSWEEVRCSSIYLCPLYSPAKKRERERMIVSVVFIND